MGRGWGPGWGCPGWGSSSRALLSHLSILSRPRQGRVTYRRAFSTFGTWRALQRVEVRTSVHRGTLRSQLGLVTPKSPHYTRLAGGQERAEVAATDPPGGCLMGGHPAHSAQLDIKSQGSPWAPVGPGRNQLWDIHAHVGPRFGLHRSLRMGKAQGCGPSKHKGGPG